MIIRFCYSRLGNVWSSYWATSSFVTPQCALLRCVTGIQKWRLTVCAAQKVAVAALANAAPSLAKAKCSKFLQLPRGYSFFSPLQVINVSISTVLQGQKLGKKPPAGQHCWTPEGPSACAEAFVQKNRHRVALSLAVVTALLPPCPPYPSPGECFSFTWLCWRSALQAFAGTGCHSLLWRLRLPFPSPGGLFCCCAIKWEALAFCTWPATSWPGRGCMGMALRVLVESCWSTAGEAALPGRGAHPIRQLHPSTGTQSHLGLSPQLWPLFQALSQGPRGTRSLPEQKESTAKGFQGQGEAGSPTT